MTVQELIDKLNEIEEKDKHVKFMLCNGLNELFDINFVDEDATHIEIY